MGLDQLLVKDLLETDPDKNLLISLSCNQTNLDEDLGGNERHATSSLESCLCRWCMDTEELSKD